MTKSNDWTGIDLYSEFAALRGKGFGITEAARQLAQKHGASYNAVYSKIYKAQLIAVPSSRLPIYDGALKLQGDWLVLPDLHAPYHHAEFVNRCITKAVEFGVQNVLLAGDAFDFHGLSTFPPKAEPPRAILDGDTYAALRAQVEQVTDEAQRAALLATLDGTTAPAELPQEFAAAREVITAIQRNFTVIAHMMGNHEDRALRQLDAALPALNIVQMVMGEVPGKKWLLSEYYWATIESGGITWQVEHPNVSAKGASKRLAVRYGSNIIMAHGHHFSIQSDPSGRYLAIEPGMCADERRMGYVAQRHNAADAHKNGAVMIVDGRPVLINDWMG
jgi:hypothetical protein